MGGVTDNRQLTAAEVATNDERWNVLRTAAAEARYSASLKRQSGCRIEAMKADRLDRRAIVFDSIRRATCAPPQEGLGYCHTCGKDVDDDLDGDCLVCREWWNANDPALLATAAPTPAPTPANPPTAPRP